MKCVRCYDCKYTSLCDKTYSGLPYKTQKITSETFRASFYIYALRYIFRGMEKKNLVLMFSMLMCK